jgi:hypothetical protein
MDTASLKLSTRPAALSLQMVPAPATPAAARLASQRCWAVCASVVAAAAANAWVQLPWLPEALYLGTTAAAATLTCHRLFWQWVGEQQQARRGSRSRRHPQRRQVPGPVLAAGALAVLMMAACLPLDPLLCASAGPWLGTVALLFFASDLGFAALVGLAAAGEGGEGPAAAAAKAD